MTVDQGAAELVAVTCRLALRGWRPTLRRQGKRTQSYWRPWETAVATALPGRLLTRRGSEAHGDVAGSPFGRPLPTTVSEQVDGI
jgi:hypothetical protein